MKSYKLYFKCLGEWIPAVRIVADERIHETIYANNINDAIVTVIKNTKGIQLDGTNKLVCQQTGEFKIF